MKPDRIFESNSLRRAYWKTSSVNLWREIWDGAEHFDRVSDLWEQARESIVVVGWQLDSRIPMKAPHPSSIDKTLTTETLREKVLRLCSRNPRLRFYLLLWDHPIFYLPQREWLQTRVWEELHPRVHLVFDNHHPLGASHHEKLVIVDGQIALVGSVDLCGDRWDTPQHPAFSTARSLDHRSESHGPYHELGVEIHGPAAAEMLSHVRERWRHLSSIPFPPQANMTQPERANIPVLISRTRSDLDQPLTREVEFLFRTLIESARRRLWLEGQYFWSERVALSLLRLMKSHCRRVPHSSTQPLEIVLILADNTQMRGLSSAVVHHQTRLLARLQNFAKQHPAKINLQIYRPFSGSRPIYVHSKLILVDDEWLSIGSANFSERALRLDSEIMITLNASRSGQTEQRRHLRGLWSQLRRHWGWPLKLVRVDAPLELEMLESKTNSIHRRILHFPWQQWLDPSLPFFYRLKRKLRKYLSRSRNRRIFRSSLATICWAIGSGAPLLYAYEHFSGPRLPVAILVGAGVSATWILPTPLLSLLVLGSCIAGPQVSEMADLMLLAWWTSILMSTAWGRVLPGIQRDWLERNSKPILTIFGKRRFILMLLVWLSPNHTAHQKLISQSQYFTPLPWIFLIHAVLLAPALYIITHLISRLP